MTCPLIIQAFSTTPDAITKLWVKEMLAGDGREIRIHIGSNERGKARVMVINHYATAEPERMRLKPGVTYSSSDPIKGLKSRAAIAAHYPPDPGKSGLWVEGVQRPLVRPLTVIYVSDKCPATELDIPDGQRDRFLADAKTMDPFAFVERWVRPRLPSSQQGGAAGS